MCDLHFTFEENHTKTAVAIKDAIKDDVLGAERQRDIDVVYAQVILYLPQTETV